jgi:hypothetical protein
MLRKMFPDPRGAEEHLGSYRLKYIWACRALEFEGRTFVPKQPQARSTSTEWIDSHNTLHGFATEEDSSSRLTVGPN